MEQAKTLVVERSSRVGVVVTRTKDGGRAKVMVLEGGSRRGHARGREDTKGGWSGEELAWKTGGGLLQGGTRAMESVRGSWTQEASDVERIRFDGGGLLRK